MVCAGRYLGLKQRNSYDSSKRIILRDNFLGLNHNLGVIMSRYPLLMTIGLLGLCWLSKFIFPQTFQFKFAEHIGWGLFILGVLLVVFAAGLFRVNATTVNPVKEPNKLVTVGLYRITRNPMYLGMLMTLLGFPCILNSSVGEIFPLIFFLIMDRKVIPREEKTIEKVFGKKYRDYKMRTRRWI